MTTTCVDFGKHKGRPWDEVPVEYLHWIRDHEGGTHTKRPLAMAELTRRAGGRQVTVRDAGGSIEIADGSGVRFLLARDEAVKVADRLREVAA